MLIITFVMTFIKTCTQHAQWRSTGGTERHGAARTCDDVSVMSFVTSSDIIAKVFAKVFAEAFVQAFAETCPKAFSDIAIYIYIYIYIYMLKNYI